MRWPSIRSTRTSFILEVSVGLPRQLTAAPRGGICLMRGLHRVSAQSLLIQPPPVDHGVYDVAIDSSTHPSTLYITEQDGMFKSIDSGQSWTLIHEALGNSRNRLSVVNSTLYLLGPRDPDHNLYKSMDRGAT